MLQVNASLSTDTMALQKAILVYGKNKRESHYGDGNASEMAHATVNDVDMSSGAPVLLPGRLVTQTDLKELVQGLSQSQALASPCWMDATMLAMGAGRMVWYTPPCHRPMFFKPSSFIKNSLDGHGNLPTPGLVWMVAQGDLYVYAYKEAGKARPEKATKLCQAPFFNVWSQGKVCTGNAHMPVGDNAAIPHLWVDAFFQSSFTHPNFTEKDRLIKGICPVGFWKSMLKKPRTVFPKARLVDLSLTVDDLLAQDYLVRIGNKARARGEF